MQRIQKLILILAMGIACPAVITAQEIVQFSDSSLYRYGFSNLFVNKGYFRTDIAYDAQIHPMAYTFIKSYLKKHGKYLIQLKSSGLPYFILIENILKRYKLPKELKYLAVIESSLDPYEVSPVGAKGPWQLMPQTARRYGLQVNALFDERTDYEKSTRAAALYLTRLYHEFHDWLLVIAAYNGGEGRVRNAIKKAGQPNFWSLQYYLPEESRNHVKKFIATHYVLEGQGGITTSGATYYPSQKDVIQLTDEEIATTASERITGKYQSSVVIRVLDMEAALFHRLNPDFDKILSAGNPFDIRLPKNKLDLFAAKRNQILEESLQYLINHPGTAHYPEQIQLPVPQKGKSGAGLQKQKIKM